MTGAPPRQTSSVWRTARSSSTGMSCSPCRRARRTITLCSDVPRTPGMHWSAQCSAGEPGPYSPYCLEGVFSEVRAWLREVASCLSLWKALGPGGSFSSGQGAAITMADATEFSPLGALDIAGLQDGFRGELHRPADTGYEDARKVWNGSIDRLPALIARCAGVADVVAAVKFAKHNGLLVAVRGGGHSYPGLSVCDGGIVIDLSLMKGIRVDPEALTVRAQAGVLLGELDRETQAFGLAVPSGIVTHTGLSGLTLGGGINWLQRKYGLTIDQLLSVDLITAEGEFVKASASENPELFWGVRGGGGNFGIVTEFEFRLNPVGPTVLAGPIFWPIEEAPNVLRFYREWIKGIPDELMTIVSCRKAPPLPFVPRELHGKLVVGVVCCYAGPVEEGEKVVKPLKEFGSPVLDLCVPKPFLAHQGMFDLSFQHGWWYYMRACDVAELTDESSTLRSITHSASTPR